MVKPAGRRFPEIEMFEEERKPKTAPASNRLNLIAYVS
jgi:hypothetical protein